MLQDPISDMLTRIRNALMVKKTEVLIPFSKVKWAIAKILKDNNYIESVDKAKVAVGTGSEFDHIVIQLKYNDHTPAIRKLSRVRTPGRRIYVRHNRLPIVLNNFGIAIISTPVGLMTNKAAKRQGLGGEVVCEI